MNNNNNASKPFFQSKTAVVAVLTTVAGAVGNSFPTFGQLLQNNAGTILLVLGGVNFGLRMVTRGRVTLFNE